MKSKNSGVNFKPGENPFLANDPDLVWEELKKKARPISREELALKIKEAQRLQALEEKNKRV